MNETAEAVSERVRISVVDHVAEVALSRPDKHNGLDYAMFMALSAAIDEVAATPAVRAVVLYGEGPSFCAGLDFAAFISEQRPVDALFVRRDGEDANLAQRVAYGWQALPMPVIAALQGNCIGGGAQIALGADIRIGSLDTRISIREVAYGLIPDMGATASLPRLVTADVAKELVWTGRFVSAEEALRIGLLTKVEEEPLEAARELAKTIASHSPDAIRHGKQLIEACYGPDPAVSLPLEERLQRELMQAPNQIAAVTATMIRQPAEFIDPPPTGVASG